MAMPSRSVVSAGEFTNGDSRWIAAIASIYDCFCWCCLYWYCKMKITLRDLLWFFIHRATLASFHFRSLARLASFWFKEIFLSRIDSCDTLQINSNSNKGIQSAPLRTIPNVCCRVHHLVIANGQIETLLYSPWIVGNLGFGGVPQRLFLLTPFLIKAARFQSILHKNRAW